jgi:hypothetical protein
MLAMVERTPGGFPVLAGLRLVALLLRLIELILNIGKLALQLVDAIAKAIAILLICPYMGGGQ